VRDAPERPRGGATTRSTRRDGEGPDPTEPRVESGSDAHRRRFAAVRGRGSVGSPATAALNPSEPSISSLPTQSRVSERLSRSIAGKELAYLLLRGEPQREFTMSESPLPPDIHEVSFVYAWFHGRNCREVCRLIGREIPADLLFWWADWFRKVGIELPTRPGQLAID
jgi:hypothetical protein